MSRQWVYTGTGQTVPGWDFRPKWERTPWWMRWRGAYRKQKVEFDVPGVMMGYQYASADYVAREFLEQEYGT